VKWNITHWLAFIMSQYIKMWISKLICIWIAVQAQNKNIQYTNRIMLQWINWQPNGYPLHTVVITGFPWQTWQLCTKLCKHEYWDPSPNSVRCQIWPSQTDPQNCNHLAHTRSASDAQNIYQAISVSHVIYVLIFTVSLPKPS